MSWKDKIRDPDCTLCPLHESAEHVCLMGSGTRKAKYMVVGEAPGEREDAEQKPFVGRSGVLLRTTLQEAGLDPEEAYITNVVKCRPPDNTTPSKLEARTCAGTYLAAEIERVEPDYILALGNTPIQALLGRSGITKHRGTLVSNVFPTFHPAYVLRSPQFEPTFRSDIERFGRLLRGEGDKGAPSKVRIIKTKAGLQQLKQRLATEPIVAFDFETNDRGSSVPKDKRYFQPWEPGAAIVCVSFSWVEGESVVVPLWHNESPWQDKWQRVLKYLAPALERDVKLVAHNGKFDCKWAWQFGAFWKMTFDTMLAAHIIDENRLKGLKPLSEVLLGASAYALELLDTHKIPLKKLSRYAGKDTDYTLRLYHIFKEQFKEEPRSARVFAKLMMPASHVLTKVELGGMYLDPERTAEQIAKVADAKAASMKKLKKHVPKHKREQINFNSPQQMGKWLFGDLKLPLFDLTKSGAPSTNESVMLRLANMHPAPALLLEYRKHKGNLEKLTSWSEKQDERHRVHTNYKLYGTVTGRLSSEKPNLQQVPREGPMRTCFGAPPGWKLVEADYSQVELRIAAMLARDGTLLRIFATGGDPHLTTAVEVANLEGGSWTPESILASDKTGKTEFRKKAKAVNFGFLYRMGSKKFVEYARDNYGVNVTPTEAEQVRQRYYSLYSRLLPWHDRQVRLAHRYGRVNSPIGRIRHLPTVRSSESGVRADAERQAINSPVQSFASDLMLLSLVRLDSLLHSARARVVGTVHDALLFEVRDDYLDTAVPIIRETMEDLNHVKKLFGTEVTVPIEVEIKVGQHWGAGEVVPA